MVPFCSLRLLGYVLVLSGVVLSFTPCQVTRRCALTPTSSRLFLTPSNDDELTRREFWKKASFAVAPALLSSTPVCAKETEPLTRENVEAAFAALAYELRDPNGGVQVIQRKIDERDWEGVLDFTKNYDLVLRKQKWARAKSFLTNNAEKEVATIAGNAVTFDLIGINRACRAGKENADLANKYLNELRTDIQSLIDMQKTIQYDQGGFDMYMNEIRGG